MSRRAGRMATGAAALTLAAGAAAASAQRPAAQPNGPGACGAARGPLAPATQRWSGALARVVAVQARDVPLHDVPLRDALHRLAAAARVRLSYSAELLPLERGVCLSRDTVALGDALAELLRGTGLVPVAVGADQVVLAPAPPGGGRSVAAPTPAPVDDGAAIGAGPARVLDRVVVTGSAAGASQRALTVALDVLDGPTLARRGGGGTLAQLLDDAVPGMWAWEQSPSSLVARYGSIRGASSFGANHPKVYVDGIEVANPLLATRLDLDAVERVEVIRGPQGAALYGSDAISGVVNIVTRHAGAPEGGMSARLRTGAGLAGTDYAGGAVLAQQHALSVRAGSARRSGGLSLDVASLGEYAPRARSRDLLAAGDVRLVGARASLTGLLRVADRRTDAAARGARELAADGVYAPGDSATRQAARQYTAGVTATLTEDDRWTHTATLGVDGYRLTNALDEGGPLPGPAAAVASGPPRSGADRGTLRLATVGRVGAADATAGSLTLAVEHSAARETMSAGAAAPGTDAAGTAVVFPGAPAARWYSTTGLLVQGSGALRDAYFVTAGVRVERGAGTGVADLTTLPMFGVATVRAVGPATLKLRAAYGKGIRTASTALRQSGWMAVRRPLVAAGLDPEEQAGVEGGVDLLLGSALGLHVTRFDQRATGIIQPVIVGSWGTAGPYGSSGGASSGSSGGRVLYLLQNVGEIDNRGWELRGTAAAGRLSAAGTLSLVASRVGRLAAGYTGDLRPGDRMLDVPARTASLTASWTAPRWLASWTVTRAADWVGYDRLALAGAVTSESYDPRDLEGARLRAFWRRYDGVTRLRASVSRDIGRGVTVQLTGDNLLDRQHGEPDNATVLPGRTVTAGLRATF